MANTIRIPRSVSTNTPAALDQGELAYSEDGSPNGEGELFIGTAGPAVTKITSTLLTGTDGVAAQPNTSAQDNQSITTGTGIDGADGGSTGNITISLALDELSVGVPVTGDWLAFDNAGVSEKALISAIPLSIFNDDLGHGQVDSVGAGVGLIGSGTAADPVLTLDFSELTDMTASISGTTEFILQDGTTESRKTANEIQLQFFDNSVAEFVSENDTLVAVDWNWVIDEDSMVTDSDAHVPTQQSVKAYVDGVVASGVVYKGGFDPTAGAGAGSPDLDSITSAIGDMYTVTVAGTYNWTTGSAVLEIGDVLISEVAGVANDVDDWTIVQTNLGAASETSPGYIELATQGEMDTATDDLRAVTPLKYANSTIDGGTF